MFPVWTTGGPKNQPEVTQPPGKNVSKKMHHEGAGRRHSCSESRAVTFKGMEIMSKLPSSRDEDCGLPTSC